MAVLCRKDGLTGYVELDNPPVNAIGLAIRQGLLDAVEWAERERLERVIVTGRGRVFAAGGDAREFDLPPEPPHLPDVLNRIETSFVPWIAAAHGVALGGGLELMLACRYRIAAPGTQLGLPEVTLGIVPGAGGTQRLPKLAGLGAALDLIPSGRSLSAVEAKALKLIDEIADDPQEAAEMINSELLSTFVPVGDLPSPDADAAAFEAARATTATRMRGQVAPLKAIDLAEQACRLDLKEGLKAERAMFLELRNSEQARALRHIFFAERAAGPDERIGAVTVPEPGAVCVVGGGTMGAGIAYALLIAGMDVTVIETDAAGVDRAKANVENLIDAGLKRGVLAADKADAMRARLSVGDDYAEAAGCNLAIEAAFESMEVKKVVFAKLQAALPADAVLASNTSYLDIDEIAAGIDDPTRFIGLHFFAPAHIMKLLEIVRGRASSDAPLATGFRLAKKLRKIPVLAGVCDGFIGNRILARYREAADTLLMDGTNPWELDEAMVDFGYAMGPYEAQDLSGLDIAYANRRRQDATRDKNRRYIPIADRMVNEGRLGRKIGAGWYRYPGGGGKVVDPLIEDLVLEEARFAGVTRREFSADEIRRRLLLAMINEACGILHEGIAASATDIDLVTVFGYGFPRWRGGLMHYADTLGPAAVLSDLQALSEEDAVAWRPSPMIEDCAAASIPFRQWRR
jgi:3-hydroxyacyl-CoA dehydrogenase